MMNVGSHHGKEMSRTELHSHAYSIVFWRIALITHDSGKAVYVGPFTKKLGKFLISNLCKFQFYDWCSYREETVKFFGYLDHRKMWV